ncbi:MAG: hypothetical protein JWR04_3357 [Rhodoglobus sp.]|nr:hypothetical protein [Rhodoglobus sp.]
MPALYYGLAVLWTVFAIAPWFDPAFVGGTGRAITMSVLGGALALFLALAATLTVVMRHRGVWPISRAPSPQESDPRLRA